MPSRPTDDPRDRLTVPPAARLLELPEGTLRRYADAGVIPAERDTGNRRVFRRADLEAFAARRAVKAALRSGGTRSS